MVWTNAAYPFANPWAGRQFNPWTGQLEVASPTASPVVQADSPMAVSSSGMLGGADASPAKSADSTPSAQPNERARQGIVDAFTDNAKLGAVKGIGMLGTSMAMGAPVTAGDFVQGVASGVMNPSNAASIAGDVISASAGLSKPQSVWGKALSRIPGLAMGMLNPLAGVAYGVFGPVATDAVMDATDTREGEVTRDALEDAYGYTGGRRAYSGLLGFGEALAKGSPSAALNFSENAVMGTQPKYYVDFVPNVLNPSDMQRGPKGWADTNFGSLTQNQGWAARQDRRDAFAKDVDALKAAARVNASSRSGSSGGGTNSSGARGSMGAGSDHGESKGRGMGGR